MHNRIKPGGFVYGVQAQRYCCVDVTGHTPPKNGSGATVGLLEEVALAPFRTLGCRDLSRFNVRIDAQGAPGFIDTGPSPGAAPQTLVGSQARA